MLTAYLSRLMKSRALYKIMTTNTHDRFLYSHSRRLLLDANNFTFVKTASFFYRLYNKISRWMLREKLLTRTSTARRAVHGFRQDFFLEQVRRRETHALGSYNLSFFSRSYKSTSLILYPRSSPSSIVVTNINNRVNRLLDWNETSWHRALSKIKRILHITLRYGARKCELN